MPPKKTVPHVTDFALLDEELFLQEDLGTFSDVMMDNRWSCLGVHPASHLGQLLSYLVFIPPLHQNQRSQLLQKEVAASNPSRVPACNQDLMPTATPESSFLASAVLNLYTPSHLQEARLPTYQQRPLLLLG
jgi:hypothetical protein